MSQAMSFDPASPERYKKGLMTSWERTAWNRGIEQGIERGKHDLVVRLVRLKFGEGAVSAIDRIMAIDDRDRLDEVAERLLTASSIDDLGLV